MRRSGLQRGVTVCTPWMEEELSWNAMTELGLQCGPESVPLTSWKSVRGWVSPSMTMSPEKNLRHIDVDIEGTPG